MKLRIAILTLICLTLTSCLKHELQSGLTEAEAQEIIIVLQEHGLEADRSLTAKDREAPTWTVSLKGGNQNLVAAWRILQENGLPRPRVKGFEETYANPGLIPTAGEEKAKMMQGLTGEISRTLKSVARVIDVRVHVVLPENSALLDKSQWAPATASVLMKYQGDQPPLTVPEVKQLVSKGVEGLQADNIAVVMKKVEMRKEAAHDIMWYLGNQELLAGAVFFLAIMTILALTLTVQVRRLKSRLATALMTSAPAQEALTTGARK